MQIEVKTVKMKDIRDKELLYLVIENKTTGAKTAINVGQKTFDGVNALLTLPQPELTNVSTGDKTFNSVKK